MFKPIKGWESSHSISKEGQVFVKERMVKGCGGSSRKLKEHFIKWNYQKGYPTACLYASGRMKRYFVHRLVYETYVEKVPNGMQINHIDGIKDNNALSNLELVTPKENSQHAWRTGLSKKRIGENCSTSKLKDVDIRKIREMSKSKHTQKEIANTFSIHETNVHYILSGKTWSHVT